MQKHHSYPVPLRLFVKERTTCTLKYVRLKHEVEYFLWAYRAPWVCAPVGVRRARLSIELLLIWRLVMDLTAQIIETLAVWALTHHQPGLYPTSTWLCALKTAGGKVTFHRCEKKCEDKTEGNFFPHIKIDANNSRVWSVKLSQCAGLLLNLQTKPIMKNKWPSKPRSFRYVRFSPLPNCRRSTEDTAPTHRIVARWVGCDPHSCW